MRDRWTHTCDDDTPGYTSCEACDLDAMYRQEAADDARAEAEEREEGE